MADPRFNYPYVEGNILLLNIRSLGKRLPSWLTGFRTIKLEIFKVREVTRVAVLMLVQPVEIEDAPIMVLKLHDRRYATQYRPQSNSSFLPHTTYEEWHPSTDKSFINLMQQIGMPKLEGSYGKEQDRIVDAEQKTTPEESWLEAEREAYIYEQTYHNYLREKAAYAALLPLQGLHVPTLYADVQYQPSRSMKCPHAEPPPPYLAIPGLLLEFIDGFSLNALKEQASPEDHQKIGDGALAVLHMMDSYNVLLRSPDLSNILVAKTPRVNVGLHTLGWDYKPVFLDFVNAKVRSGEDSDKMWTMEKARAGEEAKIAGMLEVVCRSWYDSTRSGRSGYKYPFLHRPSGRYAYHPRPGMGYSVLVGPIGVWAVEDDKVDDFVR